MKKMTEEKILTEHPSGKSGKNISQVKYETIKHALMAALQKENLTHTELVNLVYENLKDTFEGNIHWYTETVKLDLEARKVIERTKSKPPKYSLK